MKRIAYAVGIFYLISCSLSCKKTDLGKVDSPFSAVSLAKAYFENQVMHSNITELSYNAGNTNKTPRITSVKYPIWSEAYVKQFSKGEAVVVPLHYQDPFLVKSNLSANLLYSIEDVSHLLVYKDSTGQFHAENVLLFPDSSNGRNSVQKFSGLIIVEDWFGSPVTKFICFPDGSVKKYSEELVDMSNKATSHSEKNDGSNRWITVCYEISGYNYSKNNPGESYYWSEPAGCSTFFAPDEVYNNCLTANNYSEAGSGGGGGGGNSVNPVTVVTVLPGRDIITNYKNYTKCFEITDNPSHSYQVTLCVAQPRPGTRTTWTLNPVSGASSSANDIIGVGHTFLVLKEISSNGIIVRNVGFYPSMSVDPSAPSSIGNLNNDESHEYDVSLSINLTGNQFSSLINYFGQASSSNLIYDLNIFNCTTFAVNALSSIGYNLPRTTGTWPNGAGMNPGDLGEDIREMTLGANMSRKLENQNHANEGQCN